MAKILRKEIYCVVLGHYESTGMAAMEVFKVSLSQEAYDNGDHYDQLRTLVTDREKYQNQYSDNNIVVFDENDASEVGFVYPEGSKSTATLIAI